MISKKVTKMAGIVSIISATFVTLFLKIAGSIWPSIMVPVGDPNGDPFGIPIIYPALTVAVLSLLIVTPLSKPPSPEILQRFFPDKNE
jgi:hypothetical protein